MVASSLTVTNSVSFIILSSSRWRCACSCCFARSVSRLSRRYLAPLPFLGLEIFVGFIQALVFAMLTAVFLQTATMSHDEHEQHAEDKEKQLETVLQN